MTVLSLVCTQGRASVCYWTGYIYFVGCIRGSVLSLISRCGLRDSQDKVRRIEELVSVHRGCPRIACCRVRADPVMLQALGTARRLVPLRAPQVFDLRVFVFAESQHFVHKSRLVLVHVDGSAGGSSTFSPSHSLVLGEPAGQAGVVV